MSDLLEKLQKHYLIAMKTLLITLIVILALSHLHSQTQVTAFQSQQSDKGSFVSDFLTYKNKIFFEADNTSYGRELWMSDGNQNGATLLKDIFPGNQSSILTSFTKSSVILNDELYFVANDGTSDGELWKTDGTALGTEKVTSQLNSKIQQLTLIGDYFYFLIKRENVLQVWRSNGTFSGTRMIKDSISIWNEPSFQGKANDIFIFTFQPNGSNRSTVWRSDGTKTGTHALIDYIDGNGAGVNGTAALTQYIEYLSELYFVSRHFLHKTDGHTTTDIIEMHNATTDLIEYADVIEVNDHLYFSFFDFNARRLFIWESDGTQTGSLNIYDEIRSNYFMTSNLSSWGNQLVLLGPNQSGGTSLLTISLLDYAVSEIKQLEDSSNPPFLFVPGIHECNIEHTSGGLFFISALVDFAESIGWVSQLTDTSTIPVPGLHGVRDVFPFNDLFYFAILTNEYGSEFGRSDGTEANTFLLDNINPFYYGMTLTRLATVNSKLIFNGNDGDTGDELWSYDGTNLVNVKDIRPGTSGSFPREFHPFNNDLCFSALNTTYGWELWRTDGTPEGTQLAHDISSGPESSFPAFLRDYKEELYFIAFINEQYHLCKTNGTDLEIIKDLGQNKFGIPFAVLEMVTSGSFIYFTTDAEGEDLWISDGTETGTYPLKDFFTCNQLTDVDGRLFFTAFEEGDNEIELWTSDGTTDGTILLDDGEPGFSSEPQDLISYKGKLVYSANTRYEGREIWRSNGILTSQIMDFYPGYHSTVYHANFCQLNDLLYFNGGYNVGKELYSTNAMSPYPALIKDIRPGKENSFPSALIEIKNQIYFRAYTDETGMELWVTNGTPGGTTLAADILPGEWSSSPTDITAVGDDIYFIAETLENGRQIWKIPFELILSDFTAEPQYALTPYPVPAHDLIYLKAENEIDEIFIYNAQGQMVLHPDIDENRINISPLGSGVYFIKCNMEGHYVM